MTLESSSTENIDQFSCHFRTALTTVIREDIESIRDQQRSPSERVDVAKRCLINIASLFDNIRNFAALMPAHDQKSYTEAVKRLQEDLSEARRAPASRTRFTFKSTRKSAPKARTSASTSVLDPSGLSVSTDNLLTPSALNFTENGVESLPQNRNNMHGGLTISKKTREMIVTSSAERHHLSTAVLSDIVHCYANLGQAGKESNPFANLFLNRVSRSAVVCGAVDGSVHMTGLKDVVVMGLFRQFRMHDCEACHVYLHCSTRPIIEDCKNVAFAPLPASLGIDTSNYGVNVWDEIDDFRWLKAEQSPNCTIIPETERISEATWRRVDCENNPAELDMILRDLHVIPV